MAFILNKHLRLNFIITNEAIKINWRNYYQRRNQDSNLGGAKVLCSRILKSWNINIRG